MSGITVNRPVRMRALLLASLLLGSFGAHAQDAAPTVPSPENLIRQMSTALKAAQSFSVHAEIAFDNVLNSGQKLEFAGAADLTVRRPDGVYIDYRDDLSAIRFWYDGKTGTLLDVPKAVYSRVDLPADIDAVVDQLQQRYALTLPLEDLISSDLFAKLDERAVAWGYIGVNDAGGTPAHHVAIVLENVDVQLWIRKDGDPLPLKLVITYKNVPQAPQWQALLMDWVLGENVSASRFEPLLPKGSEQIEMLVVEAAQ
jgi:hypothetical protein